MPTTIQFEGQEYTSVEAMAPDIRKAYEKARHKAGGAAPYKATSQPQHPWDGKTRSGGMTVPAGFEGVTTLGQPEHVYLVKPSGLTAPIFILILGLGFLLPGLYMLVASKDSSRLGGIIFMVIGGLMVAISARNLWTLRLRIQALVVYHDGFACKRGSTVQVWPWLEIATIFSNQTFYMSSRHSSLNRTERDYTLAKKSGEKIMLTSDQFENIIQLIEVIKRRTLAVLLPPLEQTYNADQPVTFGPVTISRKGGIDLGGKHLAWGDVQQVEVKDGKLLVSMKQGGHHAVRASTIPNVEALCQLIGLDPWTIDLTHI